MTFKKNTLAAMLLPLLTIAAAALPAAAAAETRAVRNDWVNSSVVVWKNPFGQCWQGRHWMPSAAGEDCAGDRPSRQPAVLLAQPDAERRTLALQSVAGTEQDYSISTLDLATGAEPGRTMITRCFTTQN